MDKYIEWIKNYQGDIFRQCVKVCQKMKEYFPELRIAKGLVQIMENCKWYEHMWLIDEQNNIIDPTVKQWLGIIAYREIKEGDPYPIQHCMNCGEWVFSNMIKYMGLCSEECFDSYRKYMEDDIL
jgi:hypothetical protein